MTDIMKELTLSGNLSTALQGNPGLDAVAFTRGFTVELPEAYGETPVEEAAVRAAAVGVEFNLTDPFCQGVIAGINARQKGYWL